MDYKNMEHHYLELIILTCYSHVRKQIVSLPSRLLLGVLEILIVMEIFISQVLEILNTIL